ncbi:glycosyltransferase family 2 protein [Polluticoccus soli]|uniref:glycosyltransferase family 2 protein n=1 Tax=Polluticoccus soli TaxID=3034150 RepID=UPI0023E11E44|nr:glycosyltransferase family 2 protein [Flavipsychrobacter sp. JY13-12]
MFSIIIPTWNNVDFVKLCVESIRKNSTMNHQVILHINDGSDGTKQWAEEQRLDFTHTDTNAGICVAVNTAAGLAAHDYIVYMNDDMYVCPGWDKHLADEIKTLGTDMFMLSSTMIEPNESGNRSVVVQDFGKDLTSFDEAGLLSAYERLEKPDWNGSAWPPTIVHKKYWQITGGYSIEFSPGLSSDDDFAMKMWQAGCRIFKGVGRSKVYHFQSKSLYRIKKNNGRKQFLMKWGINQSTFNKFFLRRGALYKGPLTTPQRRQIRSELWRAWLKRKLY